MSLADIFRRFYLAVLFGESYTFGLCRPSPLATLYIYSGHMVMMLVLMKES